MISVENFNLLFFIFIFIGILINMMSKEISYKDAIRLMKKAEERLNHNADMSWMFTNYYLPVEQAQFYMDLACKDESFYWKVQKNMRKEFTQYLKERITHNTNQINLISGPPGQGKSYVGMKIMFETNRLRELIFGKGIDYYYAFNPSELSDKLKKMKDGDFVQCDEWKRMGGVNSRSTLGSLENIMATMRFTEKCVNLCTPMDVILVGMTSIFVPFGQKKGFLRILKSSDLIKKGSTFEEVNKYIIELYGKKFSLTKREYFKIKNGELKPDPNDMITRCLWYSSSGVGKEKNKFFLIGVLYFNVGSMHEMIKDYEIKKRESYRDLEKRRGSSGANTDDRHLELEEIAMQLYEYAKTQGYPNDPTKPGKDILDLYLSRSGIGSGLTGHETNKIVKPCVVELALKDFNGELDRKENEIKRKQDKYTDSIELKMEFTYDIQPILDTYKMTRKNNDNKIRDLDIYNKVKFQLMSYEDINKEHDEFKGKQAVYAIIKKIDAYINYMVGDLYELFRYPHLKKEYKSVFHGGGIGELDFEIDTFANEKIFESCKCFDFKTKIAVYFEKHKPEIDAARKYYKKYKKVPVVRVHIYNRFNNRCYTRFVKEGMIKSKMPITKKHRHIIRVDSYDEEAYSV